jgi:GTP-dependent dephospho-CoA kinase
MRSRLAKPLGRLLSPSEISSPEFARILAEARFVVTVGDRVTDTIAAMGRIPDVQVVDGRERRVNREPPTARYDRVVTAANPAGAITSDSLEALKTALKGGGAVRLMVDGEEDLLAIPAVLLSPEGAAVFYGQPGEGMVLVWADGGAKERSRKLLAEMGVPQSGLS